MQKMRVGVLMGGKSIEREVSFNSGRTVCDHLDTSRYEIIPIFQTSEGKLYLLPWHFLHRGKVADFKHRLTKEAKAIAWDDLKTAVDFIFIAMHGKFAEDGTVQGFLEILQIPYLGSKVFGSALGMDKIVQKNILRSNGIDVAKGIALYPNQIKQFLTQKEKIFSELERQKIHPPYIVKPHQEGSSLGVEIVKNKDKLEEAIKRASTITPGKTQAVLIEEKIDGIEISCCLITDYHKKKWKPLIPTEIVKEPGTEIYDYKQKYMPGLGYEHTPARCSQKNIEKIQQTCITVAKLLDIKNTARIDGFLTKEGKFVVVDPNTLTGMAPSSFFFREAAESNINHTQLINHLIETELDRYGMLANIIKQEKTQAKKMRTKRIKVAILLGGRTHEKEISLESGRNIIYKLSLQKYEPIAIFVSHTMELYKIDNKQLVRNSTKEIEELLEPTKKIKWDNLPNIADFVFIALHGGEGENGSIQGTLEMLDVPYNGSPVLASALCADKFRTNQFLRSNSFDVPHSILISKKDYLQNKESIDKNLTFPLILKPHDDGCSVMVQKIKNKKELHKNLNAFFKTEKKYAMLEEMLTGMELTVGVIGNENPKALPPSQAVATKEILSIEEKFLPGAGENQTPAPLAKAALTLVQKTMEKAYKILGCKGYARIDCFYQTAKQSPTKKERIIILEVNTLPGLTPATCIFHQAAELGIKPMDFIDLIIQLGFQNHASTVVDEKSCLSFSSNCIKKENIEGMFE